MQSSVKAIDHKLFKYFSIMFFISACFMFTGSILSSNWSVNKLMAHILINNNSSNKKNKDNSALN